MPTYRIELLGDFVVQRALVEKWLSISKARIDDAAKNPMMRLLNRLSSGRGINMNLSLSWKWPEEKVCELILSYGVPLKDEAFDRSVSEGWPREAKVKISRWTDNNWVKVLERGAA